MKKWHKVTLVIIGFFIFIGFLRNQFPKDENSNEGKKEISKPFNSFTEAEKEKAVNDFIFSNDYTDKRNDINRLVKMSLSSGVKYPETLEYLYNDEWVDGSETYVFNESNFTVDSKIKNRIYLVIDFRSENNFNQKVRNKFKIVFDFKGDEPYEFVSADILN